MRLEFANLKLRIALLFMTSAQYISNLKVISNKSSIQDRYTLERMNYTALLNDIKRYGFKYRVFGFHKQIEIV